MKKLYYLNYYCIWLINKMNNNINNNDHDSLDDSNISINYSTSNEPLPKIDKLVSLGLTNADAINKKFVQIKENIHVFNFI